MSKLIETKLNDAISNVLYEMDLPKDTKNDLYLQLAKAIKPFVKTGSDDIRDHIKTMEDAFNLHAPTPDQQKALQSGYDGTIGLVQMEQFTKAMNTNPVTGEVWVPDYSNKNQKKWELIMIYKPGFGFVFGDTYCGGGHAYLGSRLVFETEEKAIYAGNNADYVKAYNLFSPASIKN